MKHFTIGNIVFHVSDLDQVPLLVVGIIERPFGYTYLVTDNREERECYPIELTKEKTIF